MTAGRVVPHPIDEGAMLALPSTGSVPSPCAIATGETEPNTTTAAMARSVTVLSVQPSTLRGHSRTRAQGDRSLAAQNLSKSDHQQANEPYDRHEKDDEHASRAETVSGEHGEREQHQEHGAKYTKDVPHVRPFCRASPPTERARNLGPSLM